MKTREKTSNKKHFLVSGIVLLLTLFLSAHSFAMGLGDVFQAGAAFMTHLAVHETGHRFAADMVKAQNVKMEFFKTRNGNFFLGSVSASSIEKESLLPFRAAGIAASNHFFNLALIGYRKAPTTYNRALLFFSGTDFLWYSVWAFYIDGSNNPSYDPVGIAQETGFSPHAIVGAAFIQTAINFYRTSTNDDTVIPYFSLDRYRADFGITVRF